MKWVIFQRNSVLITTAIAGLLVLDLAKPGYRKFALIPELKPTLAIATSSVRKTATSVTAALTTSPPQKTPVQIKASATSKPKPCTRLLDAYRRQGASPCKEFAQQTY